MDERELAQEMLNFMNEMGQFNNFLDFMEAKGFSRQEIEEETDKLED